MTINLQLNKSEKRIPTIKKNQPNIKISHVADDFTPWIIEARNRIFSLAAGDRVATIAPRIMEVGLGKVLYAANELGVDIEQNSNFCIFAPDGTVSYNPIRTQRGFSYGGLLEYDLDGIVATNNSMPNGCGFSLYELDNPPEDSQLLNFLSDAQLRLGQDQISQLGKGNHFAGLYKVLDPLSGEDTMRRFVVIHCSGHVGGHRLYHPDSWLEDLDGYNHIDTPHGPVVMLDNTAKEMYLKQFQKTEEANTDNRDMTMKEIFDIYTDWKKLEGITHQGLRDDGRRHIIGSQIDKGMLPVAFNPEEGLVIVDLHENLSRSFLEQWSEYERLNQYGLMDSMEKLNFTPHGGGYEFRYPINSVDIQLNHEGIGEFTIELEDQRQKMSFNYFREIREWMTYRRKSAIITEMAKAGLAEIKYDLSSLMQIYPLVSIPGGSH